MKCATTCPVSMSGVLPLQAITMNTQSATQIRLTRCIHNESRHANHTLSNYIQYWLLWDTYFMSKVSDHELFT
jgi:hypothetical protein